MFAKRSACTLQYISDFLQAFNAVSLQMSESISRAGDFKQVLSNMIIKTLPYLENSCVAFAQIQHLPWPVLLDSNQQGRYDIIAANPHTTLCSWGRFSKIHRQKQPPVYSTQDPLQLIKTQLDTLTPSNKVDLPFLQGAIGYFGYDWLRYRSSQLTHKNSDLSLPDLALGFYHWAIVTDHQQQQTFLVAQANVDDAFLLALKDRLSKLPCQISASKFQVQQSFTAERNQTQYLQTLEKIHAHLRQGDCYQVNFSQRFRAQVSGGHFSLYQQFRKHNASPFSAFLHTPYGTILSHSPERFLRINDKQVIAQPIKGTRARSQNPWQDQQLAQALLDSEKDRAENVMIVDLLRNDLAKNCEVGSVQVRELCALKSFANVHHLVSTIEAKLRSDRHAIDLFADCFPGGSITGAPKLRAMQIIDALEPHARHVYCGSIGYIDARGNMDCNIAIRTLLWQQNTLYCYAGGGILIDSDPLAEYQETLTKVNWAFTCLENINC